MSTNVSSAIGVLANCGIFKRHEDLVDISAAPSAAGAGGTGRVYASSRVLAT